ncbi:UNVERIFIED_CONTAM: hypothetical protein Slati_4606200 [Sesamum latifolium]|uniref:Reverse transcriptase domain-containing protein n=1 Tax=Sesamum latifolium TaxID=2727402 RepID=A0AAW2S1R3_9LAMI
MPFWHPLRPNFRQWDSVLGLQTQGRCKGLGIKQFFTIVSNRRRTSNGSHQPNDPPTSEVLVGIRQEGMAVTPAEIGELSWRVKYYNTESNVQGLRMNLDFVEEARERAAVRVAMYKASMDKVYNARVKPISFQVGDLVMRKAEASGPIEKLNPKWKAPTRSDVYSLARETL